MDASDRAFLGPNMLGCNWTLHHAPNFHLGRFIDDLDGGRLGRAITRQLGIEN